MAKLNGVEVDLPDYENLMNIIREAVRDADNADMRNNRVPPEETTVVMIILEEPKPNETAADHSASEAPGSQSNADTNSESGAQQNRGREIFVTFSPPSSSGVATQEKERFIAIYRKSEPENLHLMD